VGVAHTQAVRDVSRESAETLSQRLVGRLERQAAAVVVASSLDMLHRNSQVN